MIWLIFSVFMNAESEITSIGVDTKKQFSTLEECNSKLLSIFVNMKDKEGASLSVNDYGSYLLVMDDGRFKWQNLCSEKSKKDLSSGVSLEDILKRRESE